MKRLLKFLRSPWRMLFRKISSIGPVRHWHPTRFLEDGGADCNFALLVLNSFPLTDSFDRMFIKSLWPNAKFRVCADGGGNKVALMNHEEGTTFYPDFVCGDLDSIQKENVEYFKQHGSVMYQDKGTNSTDFTKSARILAQRIREDTKDGVGTVVTVGGLWGRFDHVMGCLNTLFLLQKEYPSLSVYCIQYCSLITLLPPGRHIIHVNEKMVSGSCGLAPVGKPAENVTTTGLEWNLKNQTLSFGSLISSSNRITAGEVHVSTDAPLLWILNFKD